MPRIAAAHLAARDVIRDTSGRTRRICCIDLRYRPDEVSFDVVRTGENRTGWDSPPGERLVDGVYHYTARDTLYDVITLGARRATVAPPIEPPLLAADYDAFLDLVSDDDSGDSAW